MIRTTTVAALLVAGAALTGCFGKEEAATEESAVEAVEPAAGVEAAAPAAAPAAAEEAAAPAAAETAAPEAETTY